MKRFLHVICLLIAAALLPAALLISRGLPADTRPYVEQKYAGWNGVLRAWVCVNWKCAGDFTRWLNVCASRFEKNHDGVYVEFTPVQAETLSHMAESGIRPPEIVLFSPGMLNDLSMLKAVDVPDVMRDDLRNIQGNAYPIAMGGYILVYNRELTRDVPGTTIAVLPDDEAHSFSAASVALLSDVSDDAPSQDMLPDMGLDLGLPANAIVEESGAPVTIDSDVMERFLRGELPTVVVSQAELARLIRLRDAGRGPDWDCAASGTAAYTDQLLLLGVVVQSGDAAAEREALAEAFAAGLLEYEAQAKLADIGAFSVTGERIHADFSAYAQLDALLNSRDLIVPHNPLRTLPTCGGLLRAIADGSIDPASALAQLRSEVQ